MAILTRALPALTTEDIERFHRNIESGSPDACWPWKLGRDKNGYGKFSAQHATLRPHRVAYFLATGIDPGNALILHSCDNPPCCNPAHLFDGTALENTLDCRDKGRMNTARGESHGTHTKPERKSRGERAGGAKLTTEQVNDIRRSYLAGGVTHQQLADRHGVVREQVSQILRGEQWRHLDIGDTERVAAIGRSNRSPIGSANPRAKVNEAIVAEMRARHVSGKITYARLAAEYGVSIVLVAKICRRELWGHVP